ncbi:hypothetical protein [Pseudooceanicola sp.]|uniref:TadE/TadG family type IV pilus assembly protein n=1 Tax=Pseudooceanicola sp. TaxID=1914328 RepID=UPI002620BE0B|nr:hypothetical protein [Pseudooceanicola sp.]MDF1856867.1 hypothetical protein [Pseudooceanicola sp.]
MTRILFARLKASLTRFRHANDGTVALEAVMLLPLLFWAYLATFSYFDMLRQQSLNQKATYTIADMLSRETDAVNDTYISNAYSLYKGMVRSDETTAMRVSVLKWNQSSQKFTVDWSEARGPTTAVTDGKVADWDKKLPLMPSGERIILVESWTNYEIPFEIGMDDFEINTFTFIRPRFAPQLPFSNS